MAGARNVMDPRRTRIIGLFSLSHEQNKARFNYAVARKQRRSQFKRNYFFGLLRKMFWSSEDI